jgi:predicted nucleotidyltransferase
MCAQNELNAITAEFARRAREIFGEALREIILYGSYARGDFDAESDVDLMILADVPREEIPVYREKILELKVDLMEKYDYEILLSTILENAAFFEEWSDASVFFQNVRNEGLKIVA